MHDAYPKTSVHLLVLPRDTSIDSLRTMAQRIDKEEVVPSMQHVGEVQKKTFTSLQLLEYMVSVGEALVQHIQMTGPAGLRSLRFQIGFHAMPSLSHLHMHVMSLDFENGPAINKKKHYQSFATSFFLPASQVLGAFRGPTSVPAPVSPGPPPHRVCRTALVAQWQSTKALLAGPMKCLWCGADARTLPMLLSHIAECERNACRLPRTTSGHVRTAPVIA
jgi:aprataxin